jgi:hypothetical protein
MRVGESFWIPGEQMLWELSARGFLGATVVLGVGEPGTYEGRRAIIVKSRVEGAGLVATFVDMSMETTTWIDMDTAMPMRLHAHERVDAKEKRREVRFEPGKLVRSVQRGDRPARPYTRTLPDGVAPHDMHSMLGILRAWTPKEGSHAYLHVMDDGRLRRHMVRFTRYETIKTALGRNPAIRLDVSVTKGTSGTKKGKPYAVWISNDANRRPLRLMVPTRIGAMRLELVRYERPPR